ncbi:17242_t:CDS:10 [Funneliformis geosporum]|uniref:Arginyl-tRNA--protein transferase 1 n=1 Tax=Funneliformis geosporum TaxID=1117311 RepID=A0A9W4SBS6_9GLOM|nr:17242_t:CDS:10 [Funneliformis geosporum]
MVKIKQKNWDTLSVCLIEKRKVLKTKELVQFALADLVVCGLVQEKVILRSPFEGSIGLSSRIIVIVYCHGFHDSSCGYCKSETEEGFSYRFGMSATNLTCKDYQNLVDTGWRRSGDYLYKPHMRLCCCPQLNVSEFRASKSQRKLITRFNRYVEGTNDPANKGVNGGDETSKSQNGAKISSKKAGSGFDLNEVIHEAEGRQDWKRRLRIVFEQSSFSKEKYELYRKYQIKIHNDEPYEVTERGFKRFLVDSPLQFEAIDKPNVPGYGSFHQCYYLDDKLIAVAVLDVLPKCISSVYFLYDPDYGFLQLGKYSVLREIAMTQEFYNAGLQDLNWYYMGYYIHTCQKMKYKGQYKPSDLLDPETYEWYSYDRCAALLDKHKYVSFANPPNDEESNNNTDESDDSLSPPGMLDPETVTDDDIKSVQLYYNNTIKRLNELPNWKSKENLKYSVKEYFAAVGKELAETMVLNIDILGLLH